MKLAVHSSSMPTASLDTLAAHSVIWGCAGIELRLAPWQGHGVDLHLAEAERRDVRATLAAHGIDLVAIGSKCYLGSTSLEELELVLRLAADCGAEFVRVFADDGLPLPATAVVAELARTWDDAAERWGVRLIFENHGAFGRLDDLVKAVPLGAVVWDAGQSVRAGEQAVTLDDRVWARVAHVHLKAVEPDGYGSWRSISLTNDLTSLQRVVRKLAERDYQGFISLETDPALLQADLSAMAMLRPRAVTRMPI